MNVGIWRLSVQGVGRKPLEKQWKIFGCRGIVESNFLIIYFGVFKGVLVLMELVGRLKFLN